VPVWLSPWDWTAADWAGVQCFILIVAAWIAFRQVSEARRLREAQAQPFVVVDFEVEERQQKIYVAISNLGTTMARDVRLTFEPELTSSFDSDPGVVPPRELKLFSDGVPSLPPGKRIRALLDIFTERDVSAYPDLYRVHITFHSPVLGRDFDDDTVLDLGLYRNVLHSNRRDVHDVHERLKELVTETRKLGRQLARLPAGDSHPGADQ
jgi:hypothetical protein